jgi:hypothetical protein
VDNVNFNRIVELAAFSLAARSVAPKDADCVRFDALAGIITGPTLAGAADRVTDHAPRASE